MDARLRENPDPSRSMKKLAFSSGSWTSRRCTASLVEKKNLLKLKTWARIAKAFTPEEKTRLMKPRQRGVHRTNNPALMLALNTGMRDAEMERRRQRNTD